MSDVSAMKMRLQLLQQQGIKAAPKPEADMSFMGRVKDNIVGVDDGVMSTGEKIGNLINQGGEALTLGVVGDEADAALAAAIPGGQNYDERLSYMRQNQAQMEQDHPVASLAAKVAPAFIPGAGMAKMVQGGKLTAQMAKGALASGVAGGVYGFAEGEGGAEERLDEAKTTAALSAPFGAAAPALAAGVKSFINAGLTRKARAAYTDAAPSVDDLLAQATSKYEDAAAKGVSASPQKVGEFVEDIGSLLRENGLISPLGRISKSYPKVSDALDMLSDYAEDAMSPQQMQEVRKLIQGIAASADRKEARIGTKMLKAFGDFVDPLAPQFREANKLYSQAMNGQMIEQAIELAGNRAGQFSGSGFENALRTEFRGLARKIIKGEIKGLSPDQVAAIKRVADGASLENAFRNLGKAAPRGVVSAGMSGGMPFLVGNAIGGPGLGFAMSGATLAAGEAGRRLATGMQTRNALAAGASMRSANTLPEITATPRVANALANLGLGAAPTVSNKLLGQ